MNAIDLINCNIQLLDAFGAVEVSLFIAQWTLVVQIMWMGAIIVPFSILAVCFNLFEWLLLDKITTFLITGSFNNTNIIYISKNSPLIIMIYSAIIIGLISLIIFILNYFVRNLGNITFADTFSRILRILWYVISFLLIPLGLLLFNIFVQTFTLIVNSIFNINVNNSLINFDDLQITLNNISKLKLLLPIDKLLWDKAWEGINDLNLIQIKNNLFEGFNSLQTELNSISFDNFVNELNSNITNPSKLQNIFLKYISQESMLKINWSLNQILHYQKELTNSQINPEQLSTITNFFVPIKDPTETSLVINNWLKFISLSQFFQNVTINPETNQFANNYNIAYRLFTRITGIPVNSLNGILNNWSILSVIFSDFPNGLMNLIKSLLFGGMIAALLVKAIFNLVTLLINRWFWILASIPYGVIAATRSTSDDGSLWKIYFRETITTFISLFIVSLNFQIMNLLLNIIDFSLTENPDFVVQIIGSNSLESIGGMLLYSIFVIIILYSNNSITIKILEIFNTSGINKNSISNELSAEYNSAKNKRHNTKSTYDKKRKTTINMIAKKTSWGRQQMVNRKKSKSIKIKK